MTPKCSGLDMRNGYINGKVHVISDKQMRIDADTVVSLIYKAGNCNAYLKLGVRGHANCDTKS